MAQWAMEATFKGQDVRSREFTATMERDGIPVKQFESENWVKWIGDRCARLFAMRRN
ncbi:MAG: hypothetical protein R6U89_03625 [Dehalococcoidia bacterium]